jgi:hypothetical protein
MGLILGALVLVLLCCGFFAAAKALGADDGQD